MSPRLNDHLSAAWRTVNSRLIVPGDAPRLTMYFSMCLDTLRGVQEFSGDNFLMAIKARSCVIDFSRCCPYRSRMSLITFNPCVHMFLFFQAVFSQNTPMDLNHTWDTKNIQHDQTFFSLVFLSESCLSDCFFYCFICRALNMGCQTVSIAGLFWVFY